jgi:hypothetical protein
VDWCVRSRGAGGGGGPNSFVRISEYMVSNGKMLDGELERICRWSRSNPGTTLAFAWSD